MNAFEAFCKHFEQFHNSPLSDLRKFYTEDVEFIDPLNHLHGLTKTRSYFSKLRRSVSECTFIIQSVNHTSNDDHETIFLTWVMSLKTVSASSKAVVVEGVTHLKVGQQGIFYHRDYFDVGELIYENVPLLKWVIKGIKRKLRE